MIDVEVQVNYLKDTDVFNKEIEVIRKGKKINKPEQSKKTSENEGE